jgi:hypothetical protein
MATRAMTFGEAVYEELRRRGLHARFRFADVQAMRAAADAPAMRAFLASRGHEAGEGRTDLLHFVDFIELQLLRRSLKEADAALVLWSLT